MRPYNTLFLCQSLDGKIAAGVGKDLSFDGSFAENEHVAAAMWDFNQYKFNTDYCYMITGKTAEMLGANELQFPKDRAEGLTCVIVDHGRITERGLRFMCLAHPEVIYISDHPMSADAMTTKLPKNCVSMRVPSILQTGYVMERLYDHGVTNVTLRTGGTYNAALFRHGVVDEVVVYILPVIVGGKDTVTLCEGKSYSSAEELQKLTRLELIDVETRPGNAVRMRYAVKARNVVPINR